MTPGEVPGLRTDFVINDQVNGYPTRSVTTPARAGDLEALVRDGYLVHRRMLTPQTAAELSGAVAGLAEAEEGLSEAEHLPGENIYLRSLLDKDRAFHPLIELEPALSIARSLLGPQVWIDLEARMNYAGRAGVAVPWHAHTPVIPDPLPPLFCFPHQIHCLIYLRRVTREEGALCVLPGSHTRTDTAKHLVAERKAPCVLTAKANQPTLFAQVKALPWVQEPTLFPTAERGHVRYETKAVRVLTTPKTAFAYTKKVLRAHRWVKDLATGRVRRTYAYVVTSLSAAQAGPERLAGLVRGHGRIEALHHVWDVSLGEDASRVRAGDGDAA
ncbi:phytanoyl-CoA dioxygenase family protein [Nocardiopsis sp. CNT312]|uniref:phytanoyl-CoA dioxygenase family protein n=1 Tax=Nocardiopsis sp. CNT312 TaxID=1137268 RepID=UPI0004AE25A4|nr:phytanoyl-CoA dioxygenase family protein [Nocardiopsis sp. CNT312]